MKNKVCVKVRIIAHPQIKGIHKIKVRKHLSSAFIDIETQLGIDINSLLEENWSLLINGTNPKSSIDYSAYELKDMDSLFILPPVGGG